MVMVPVRYVRPVDVYHQRDANSKYRSVSPLSLNASTRALKSPSTFTLLPTFPLHEPRKPLGSNLHHYTTRFSIFSPPVFRVQRLLNLINQIRSDQQSAQNHSQVFQSLKCIQCSRMLIGCRWKAEAFEACKGGNLTYETWTWPPQHVVLNFLEAIENKTT